MDSVNASSTGTFIVTPQRSIQTPTAKLPRATELGINVDKPKFPQYANISFRLESYGELNWPENAPVSVDDLAEAGLVYTGVGDSVRCYHCGGGLRNWEEGDNPMVEHARWYPTCPHVLLVKGHRFVKAVANGEPLTDSLDSIPVKENKEKNYMESDAVMAVIEMGYCEDIVKRAVKKFVEKKGHTKFRGTDLCEIIFEIEESDSKLSTDKLSDTQVNNNCDCEASSSGNMCSNSKASECACDCLDSEGEETDFSDDDDDEDDDENSAGKKDNVEELLEENERMKNNLTCKICLDKTADVIFLPCGHMVSCGQCAPVLQKCPMCRKVVQGTVKAFFATMSERTET